MKPLTIYESNKNRKYLATILALSFISVTLPISAGYLSTFIVLAWMVLSRTREISRDSDSIAKIFIYFSRPIDYGVLILLGSYILSTAIAYFYDSNPDNLSLIFKDSRHVFLKWGLLWYVLSRGIHSLLRHNYPVDNAIRLVAVWFVINLIYCILQRYTGIDLSHGWQARLGPNRLAYGVYRVSGLTGHPLTLAYNLVLVTSVTSVLAVQYIRSAVLKWWLLIIAASFLILLISGSRFPLIAPFLILIPFFWKFFLRWRWQGLFGIAVLLFLTWFEGSILARFAEFWSDNRPLIQRFDRLVFWQVYWQVFADAPLAGAGFWNTSRIADIYYMKIGQTEKMYNAHNIFLQQMADHGLIGLVGILCFIITIFVADRRIKKVVPGLSGISVIGVSLIICGLFQNNFRDSEFIYAFWFLLSFLIANAIERSKPGKLYPS